MKTGSLITLGLTLAVVCQIIGCGGGGGGGSAPQPSIFMQIGADTAITESPTVRADTVPSAPLDSGSVVAVYDFPTRRQLGTGAVDALGMCSIKATAGSTIAIVIEGTKSGRQYRLSAIVPVVPIDGGRFIANPVTSLAAEAIALKHFGRTALDQGTLDAVLEQARTFATLHPDADYCIGAGIFGAPGFGSPGCIDASMLQDIVNAVPDTINSKIVMAKNAVQQIRDADVPLTAMMSQEHPDVENVIAAATADKYQDLVDRLNTVMLPAMFGGMEYTDPEGFPIWPTIFDLEVGKTYRLQRYEEGGEGWSNSWFSLTDFPEADVIGQITLIYETAPGIMPSGTYTVIAKQTGGVWTITQTFTGDPAQVYQLKLPAPGDDPGENPTISLGASLQDSEVPTPLSFSGTVSATGWDRSSYTAISLDGSLTTPEVTASGSVRFDFPSEMPAGADPDEDTIYDYPSAFSVRNADIKVADGITTISVTGNADVSMVAVDSGSGPNMAPKHIKFDGTYANSSTGFRFEGHILGDWTNPPYTEPPDARGALALQGTITCSGRPGYSADISYTLSGATSSATISLRAGATSLVGNGTCAFDSSGDIQSAALDLKNQDGVEFAMAMDSDRDIAGTVEVANEVQADISHSGDLLRIAYRTTPKTFDDFPTYGLF